MVLLLCTNGEQAEAAFIKTIYYKISKKCFHNRNTRQNERYISKYLRTNGC